MLRVGKDWFCFLKDNYFDDSNLKGKNNKLVIAKIDESIKLSKSVVDVDLEEIDDFYITEGK